MINPLNFKKYHATIYQPTIHDINYATLKKQNKKLLVFDLDGTLDNPTTKNPTKKTKNKIKELEKDFAVFIISNNKIKDRVKIYADGLGLDFLESANKPFQAKYKSCDKLNKFKKSEIVFIGDKITTDVFGGNSYGSATILVDPTKREAKWYVGVMIVADFVIAVLAGFKRGKYYE